MQYLLYEAPHEWLEDHHNALDLGNDQFDGEITVWRSHSRKRIESRKEAETRLEACGAQYSES